MVVARFLALLEMYREQIIAFSQDAPLQALNVRWLAADADWDPAALNEEYGTEPGEPTETSPTPTQPAQGEHP